MTERIKLPMNLQFFADKPDENEQITEEVKEDNPVEQPVEVPEKIKEEPVEQANEEIASLQNIVTTLAAKVDELTAKREEPVEQPTDIPKEENEPIAVYESALNKIVEEKLTDIPDGIAALMPDNLSAVEKLDWIEKASKAVPKEEKQVEPPKQIIANIGQPTPIPTEEVLDVTKLSPLQKITMALEEKLTGK